MPSFVIKRLLWIFPILFSILVIMFLLMHAVPGSPWDPNSGAPAMHNVSMDEITRKNLDRRFGLDQPLYKQFYFYVVGRTELDGTFMCGLICGNLGPSYRQRGRAVQDILFQPPKGLTILHSRFGYSMRLGIYAFLFAFGFGIPLGVVSALRQNTWLDLVIKFLSSISLSIPSFVIGLVLIMVLGGGLHLIAILPTSWINASPEVWIIPVFVLGLSTSSSVVRLTRGSVMEVMNQDYVRTARAKGLWENTIIWVHILKNSLIPIITYAGPALVELMTGSFIIESMFGFPGMGREYINSVINRDYSLIIGLTIIYAVLIAFANIFVDFIYAVIDPRIRVEA